MQTFQGDIIDLHVMLSPKIKWWLEYVREESGVNHYNRLRCWVCNAAFDKNFVRDRPRTRFRTAIATPRGFMKVIGRTAKIKNTKVAVNHEKSQLHAVSEFAVQQSAASDTAEALQKALRDQG